ncbi:MAG: bifunctional heptose 7-phosphate kinase/heptose 1-phosphate adenyltransferase [Terriglobia bacterium]
MNKTQRRWTRIVRTFAGKTVGVFGDYMLDEFWRGQATRISPEAPVPVLLLNGTNSSECYPGGAGNVAANVAALGGDPIAWGVIGKDESGRLLVKLLARQGIRHDTLVQETGRMTPRKIRLVAHQHQLLRLDFEKAAAGQSAGSSERLLDSFSRYVARLDALIVSDYQKGSVTAGTCDRLLPLARKRRLPVFVDPKPANVSVCHLATAVTPNLQEAEAMTGLPMRDARQIERGGRALLEKFGCGYLLITRGSEGMILFAADGAVHTIRSVPRPVYDVTGAGDTVIAVLALAYCSGADMKEAAELANLAAGRVVLKFGTSQISRSELLEAIREV